ncbi:MAG TPA: hypothetical protein VG797_08785 [Phycisphaerales bacterium]|nr:hypothetical protein [Phycisphaerales bacterium]
MNAPARPGSAASDSSLTIPPRIHLEPDPRDWPALVRDQFGRLDDRARQFRRELGLPDDRPIVMSGHQLTFWHAGILAKYFAAVACATRTGSPAPGAPPATTAWLWVDEDEHDYSTIRVPSRTPEDKLVEVNWAITEMPADGLPVAACSAFQPRNLDAVHPNLPPSIAIGVSRIFTSLRAHQSAASAAHQIAASLSDLVAPFGTLEHQLFATSISRTALFAELVRRMIADPLGCARAYNAAAATVPEARIVPLRLDHPRGVELPLWRLEPNRPRARVYSNDLPPLLATPASRGNGPPHLAPRALLITGLLRLAGCDLFIHGVGGYRYDTITEQWFLTWLGHELAPKAAATADLFLPLSAPNTAEADVARAFWRAHSAEHNPAVLNDASAAVQKQSHLAAIAAERAAGRSPLVAYQQMHADLNAYRSRHAGELRDLHERADSLQDALAESLLAGDRTWAFPFHDDRSLLTLRDAIAAAMK